MFRVKLQLKKKVKSHLTVKLTYFSQNNEDE